MHARRLLKYGEIHRAVNGYISPNVNRQTLLSKVGEVFANLGVMKTRAPTILITLFCLAASLPKAQSVTPPPDGGYPGGNTAEGQQALLSLTSGTYNTAVGLFSLGSNTIGKFNTATGAGALLVNTADNNTAAGAGVTFQ